MNEILVSMAAMIAVVWAATEGIGRLLPIPNTYIAGVLGPATGIVSWRLGYLALPVEVSIWEGVLVSAFVGLLATFAAEKVHDRGAKPLARLLKGKKTS
jgi:hypothetical protein